MARRGRAARLEGKAAQHLPAGTSLKSESLAEHGLAAPARKAGRILVIGCGALAREILAIKEANGLDHLDLTCLPAKLHLYPDQIVTAVEAAVQTHARVYDQIFIAYADCGTGGLLEAKCAELGVEMIAGPHCYAFFEGNDAFQKKADEGEITAFYVTDFLAKQFDAFIWRPMGLDKNPELREMIFGNYTKLVYQSQVRDPELVEKARACATRMGLEFEHRHTGYGELQSSLHNLGKPGT